MPKKTSVPSGYLIALELAADAARRMLDDLPLAEEATDPAARLWRSSMNRQRLEGALAVVNDVRPPRRIPATFANTEETD